MNKPLVSVFLPYYNDRDFLKESIESVLNNTYQNIELILLNHATTDDCREIAHSYNDPRIKHIDVDLNYGPGGRLFQKMLKVASGKYIKPMCADDVLREDGIEILVNYMENHPNKDFAFGNVEYIDKKSEDLNNNWFNARPFFSMSNDEIKLIELSYLCCSTLPYIGSIVKLECLEKININKTYIMLFDVSIWMKLLCKGYKVGYIDKKVANYRIHNRQISGLKQEKASAHLCYYELASLWEILFEIDDVELAKRLFPNNKYKDLLTDKKDIPFYIANSLFYQKQPYAFVVLDKMVNDESYAKHLLNTFGFGVKELRELYKYQPIEQNWTKNIKSHIYQKTPLSLSVLQLLFLLFRRFIYGINPKRNFQKIKNIFKKKSKKYSL